MWKSWRIGLWRKGEDSPSIANLVMRSKWPWNNSLSNPMGKKGHLTTPWNITAHTLQRAAGLQTYFWFGIIVHIGRGAELFFCWWLENLGVSDSSPKYTLPAEWLGVLKGCVLWWLDKIICYCSSPEWLYCRKMCMCEVLGPVFHVWYA